MPVATPPDPAPTVAEAAAFVERTEARLHHLSQRASRAAWVQQTYITAETEIIAAEYAQELMAASLDAAMAARRFDGLALPAELARKLLLLKLSEALPGPVDPERQAELAELASGLAGAYGRAKYRPPDREPMDLDDLERVIGRSRDPQELLDAWTGWHGIGAPLRDGYRRLVELGNEGARTVGFGDMGLLWRSSYDVSPQAFEAQLDDLWADIRPLYTALHAYVRARLNAHYGDDEIGRAHV